MNYSIMIKLMALIFQGYAFDFNDCYIKENKKIDLKNFSRNDIIPKNHFYNRINYNRKTIPKTGYDNRREYTSLQQKSKHRTKKILKNLERKIQESKSL